MELIFAAALCSVTVSVVLKFAKDRGYSPIQMIAWNYAMSTLLCYVWFAPNINKDTIQQAPWLLIGLLGVILPSLFWCLSRCLNTAGIVKTEIAQRLSVVLSLLSAYFIFNEDFNLLKMTGIVLGLAAVGCVIWSHRSASKESAQKGIVYLSLVWAGYALVDILLKQVTAVGLQFAVALNLMFICAFVLSIGYLLVYQRGLGQKHNIIAGLGLGILNFSNIAFYVQAHRALQDSPAIVFAGMNILVVLFGVFVGVLVFKEQLKRSTALGIILGVTSVFCLAFAM